MAVILYTRGSEGEAYSNCYELSSKAVNLRCEYSTFALEVIFVEGFLATKPGFVLNLAVGTIYRL